MDTLNKTNTSITFKVKNTKERCIVDTALSSKCEYKCESCYATIKVTVKDILKYKVVDCKSLHTGEIVAKSGDFYLAGFIGSWEVIDALVDKALEHFRSVDAEKLKSDGLKVGILL